MLAATATAAPREPCAPSVTYPMHGTHEASVMTCDSRIVMDAWRTRLKFLHLEGPSSDSRSSLVIHVVYPPIYARVPATGWQYQQNTSFICLCAAPSATFTASARAKYCTSKRGARVFRRAATLSSPCAVRRATRTQQQRRTTHGTHARTLTHARHAHTALQHAARPLAARRVPLELERRPVL